MLSNNVCMMQIQAYKDIASPFQGERRLGSPARAMSWDARSIHLPWWYVELVLPRLINVTCESFQGGTYDNTTLRVRQVTDIYIDVSLLRIISLQTELTERNI